MIDTEILKQGTETVIQIGGMSIQGVLIVSFLFMLVAGALIVFFLIRYMMKSTTSRIDSLEQDKDNIREYASQTKISNDALMRSNAELKQDRETLYAKLEALHKDRELLRKDIKHLSDEFNKLRQDYKDCLEKTKAKSTR